MVFGGTLAPGRGDLLDIRCFLSHAPQTFTTCPATLAIRMDCSLRTCHDLRIDISGFGARFWLSFDRPVEIDASARLGSGGEGLGAAGPRDGAVDAGGEVGAAGCGFLGVGGWLLGKAGGKVRREGWAMLGLFVQY